jgi:NADH-quinone oxidoreductase subunit G
MPVANRVTVRPDALAASLADLAKGGAIATSLTGKRSAIVIGHYAQQLPDYAAVLAAAHDLARATGATVSVLPDGANAVGANLAGAKPTKGMDARAMLAQPRRGYLVAGVEAELDCGPGALAALEAADFTVALSAYRNATTDRAHVMLPIVPYTETGGTFVNMEGRVQSFNATVKPQGQARPGWKVLRMLGALLEIPGFHGETLQEIRNEIAPDLQAWASAGLDNSPVTPGAGERRQQPGAQGLYRIDEFAIYAGDPVARRSRPLQRTADGRAARMVRINPATAAAMKLAAGDTVRVVQGGEARLAVALDPATPQGAVRIARGVPETAALTSGEVRLEKVTEAAVA